MKRNTLKLSLNIFMAAVLLLLMDPRSFFGQWFHEIAGLAVGLFFILHMALNWAWVKATTKKFFGKAPGKSRLNYTLDILLFMGFALVIISGMAISRLIDFSWLGFGRDNILFYKSMHVSFAMMTLAIAGLHLGLHWHWVAARFKRSGKEASC